MKHWKSLLLSGLASGGAVINRSDGDNALAKCPGYKASNVKTSAHGLTARLSLAGEACNVYGEDLKNLILEVTYESGGFLNFFFRALPCVTAPMLLKSRNLLFIFRQTIAFMSRFKTRKTRSTKSRKQFSLVLPENLLPLAANSSSTTQPAHFHSR